MGQVLHGSATTTHAVRAAIQRSKAPIKELRPALWAQPEDGREMAQAGLRQRCADGAEGAPFLDAAVARRRRSSSPSAGTPCCRSTTASTPSGDHPAPDPLFPAPLLPAPRHQPAARSRGRQACNEALQGLPDRLLPHRHRRGAHRSRASCTSSSPSTAPRKFAFAQLHDEGDADGSRPTSCAR